jgi:hypothetical protein
MKKLLTLALAFTALAATADLTYGQAAASLQSDYRAGTAVFASGRSGITVRFRKPMKTGCAVVVQPTNTVGYSRTSVGTYFNVLNKNLSGFAVQHRRSDNGELVPVKTNISLDYIAVPMQP